MKTNYFHKSCNKTSRRFFEDFDMLPSEIKRLLTHGPKCPDFGDLKEAWKLAEETLKEKGFKPEDLLKLNCFEEERKLSRKEALERKRRSQIEAKQAKWRQRCEKYRSAPDRLVLVRREKDERLLKRISEEEATRRLTTRKENKDFTVQGDVEYDAYYVRSTESEIVEEKKSPPIQVRTSLSKAWGNA